MKPRIKKVGRSIFENNTYWWRCEGVHPKQPGTTCAFGATPSEAYENWLSFWDIPF